MNQKRLRRVLILVSALAIVPLLAGGAWAWVEGSFNSRSYPVTSGVGCIQQYNEVIHGTASTRMIVRPHALTRGFTAANAQLCNPVDGAGIYKLIKGDMVMVLLKLIRDGGGNNRDEYEICSLASFREQNWAWEMTREYYWGSAPCGAGNYAAFVCMTKVDTLITDLFLAFTGNYQSSSVQSCHYSQSWHPALTNSGTGIGPNVNL